MHGRPRDVAWGLVEAVAEPALVVVASRVVAANSAWRALQWGAVPADAFDHPGPIGPEDGATLRAPFATIEGRALGSLFTFASDALDRALAGRRSWRGELALARVDGAPIPVELALSPLTHPGPDGWLAIIGPRAAVAPGLDAALAATRARHEALRREIHHYVHNSLQLVASLIGLRARASSSDLADALSSLRSRVEALGAVHALVNQADDLSRVPLGECLASLARRAFHGFSAPERVHLRLELEPSELSLEHALPCCLLVDELIGNALAHAFPEGGAGTVELRLTRPDAARLVLVVADDGAGLPHEFAPLPDRAGWQLVDALVAQLDADLDVRTAAGRGTTFRVDIPLGGLTR